MNKYYQLSFFLIIMADCDGCGDSSSYTCQVCYDVRACSDCHWGYMTECNDCSDDICMACANHHNDDVYCDECYVLCDGCGEEIVFEDDGFWCESHCGGKWAPCCKPESHNVVQHNNEGLEYCQDCYDNTELKCSCCY